MSKEVADWIIVVGAGTLFLGFVTFVFWATGLIGDEDPDDDDF